MNSGEDRVSRRLQEVWDWKEANYREVAHLPTPEALEAIMRMADEAGARRDLPRAIPRTPMGRSR